MYKKDGVEYVRKVGTRQEVVDGTVYCTSGGLTQDELEVRGSRIISKKRSALGKARFQQRNPFVAAPELPKQEEPEPEVTSKKRIRKRRRAR